MNVKVIIEVSIPPQERDLDSLRRAASSLTNHQKSIAVRVTQADDSLTETRQQHFSLITTFTMRTTAQYKVVDDISREFKYQTFALEGYENIIISFPD